VVFLFAGPVQQDFVVVQSFLLPGYPANLPSAQIQVKAYFQQYPVLYSGNDLMDVVGRREVMSL
jgi:hypothetical protein